MLLLFINPYIALYIFVPDPECNYSIVCNASIEASKFGTVGSVIAIAAAENISQRLGDKNFAKEAINGIKTRNCDMHC